MLEHLRPWRSFVRASGPRGEASPPPSVLFVKPLEKLYSTLPCRLCRGTKRLECEHCSGRGSLDRGGYHKKNPVELSRIVGSKWTAMERTLGWRHFEVRTKQKLDGKQWFIEMMASCDPSVRLWVNVQTLRDRSRWSMGWLQRAELLGAVDGSTSTHCKACKGQGKVDCPACSQGDEGSRPLDIIDV